MCPFIVHPKTKVTLFVGQKSFDKHQAAEKKSAEAAAKRVKDKAKKNVANNQNI